MVVDAWQSDSYCYTGLRQGLDTDTQKCLLSNVAPFDGFFTQKFV